jgi:small-conductance mechanosensitive channel
MNSFERLRAGLMQIVGILPGLLLGLVILMAGFFVARIVERLVDALLDRMHFDREAAKWGVAEAVERAGAGIRPARVVGKLLFWGVMLIVILLASSALGVENINDIFANLVGYIPSVFAAIIVVVLGMILGEFVRGLILASAGGVEGVPTLAKVAKGVVIIISIFMALTQLGVAGDIVTTAFTLILGAAALAVGLAFGIGNTGLAGEITRRWYEAGQKNKSGRRSTDRQAAEPAAQPSSPGAGTQEAAD